MPCWRRVRAASDADEKRRENLLEKSPEVTQFLTTPALGIRDYQSQHPVCSPEHPIGENAACLSQFSGTPKRHNPSLACES